MTNRYEIREGLRLEVVDDTVLILDSCTAELYSFDGTAARILAAVAAGDDLPDSADDLGVLADLTAADLLVPSGTDDTMRRRRFVQVGAAVAVAGGVVMALPSAAAAQSLVAGTTGGTSGGTTGGTSGGTTGATTGGTTTTTTGAPPTAPAAPTVTTATLGASSALFTFTPAADGGSPLTNYEFSVDGGASWTPVNPATTASPVSITGVAGGSSIGIRAVNSVGTGPSSNLVAVAAKARTFNYSSSTASFVVPTGVTKIDVDLVGGAGGHGGDDNSAVFAANDQPGGLGGQPGQVTGTLPVTPGETLTIGVGRGGVGGVEVDDTNGVPPGGNNPLTAYVGGNGGAGDDKLLGTAAGTAGGGSGGAATVVQQGSASIIASGGAGGGGGNANQGPGQNASSAVQERADANLPAGRDGLGGNDGDPTNNYQGYRAGNGGGGGGKRGGERATLPAQTVSTAGFAGSRGSNTAAALSAVSKDGAASGRTIGGSGMSSRSQNGFAAFTWLEPTIA